MKHILHIFSKSYFKLLGCYKATNAFVSFSKTPFY